MVEWVEVWRKDVYIDVSGGVVAKEFKQLVRIEDRLRFPSTAEAGEKLNCGYINIIGEGETKIKIEVLINDKIIAEVDGVKFSFERVVRKGQTITFPIIFNIPKDVSGKTKVSVIVYQAK